MRHVLKLVLAVLCMPSLVHGQSLIYEGIEGPLFSVEFPADWIVDVDFLDEARAAGVADTVASPLRIVEAMPNDGSKLWIGFWTVPRVSTLSEALDYMASLDTELFTEIVATSPTDRDLNGMPAKVFSGTALRQGDAIEFSVALFEPRAEKIAVGLYVGQPDTWNRHADLLGAIRDSLQRAAD